MHPHAPHAPASPPPSMLFAFDMFWIISRRSITTLKLIAAASGSQGKPLISLGYTWLITDYFSHTWPAQDKKRTLTVRDRKRTLTVQDKQSTLTVQDKKRTLTDKRRTF